MERQHCGGPNRYFDMLGRNQRENPRVWSPNLRHTQLVQYVMCGDVCFLGRGLETNLLIGKRKPKGNHHLGDSFGFGIMISENGLALATARVPMLAGHLCPSKSGFSRHAIVEARCLLPLVGASIKVNTSPKQMVAVGVHLPFERGLPHERTTSRGRSHTQFQVCLLACVMLVVFLHGVSKSIS